jgi:membrane-bound lytic murein transglycosylase MltF
MRFGRLVSALVPGLAALLLRVPVQALTQPAVKKSPVPTPRAQKKSDTAKEAVALDSHGRLGDFDAMRKRRLVRVLVVYNRTNYFIDRGTPRGIVAEAFKLFEDYINQKYKTGNLRIHVALIPTRRDALASALLEGKGDIAAAYLTVTPERLEKVDFSNPTIKNVSEIVVGGASSPSVAGVDDLSGREVFVRKSSLYNEDLEKLNADLVKKGKAPVKLRYAPDNLEDEDILEMVNAGLVPYAIVDDFLGRFWAEVLPKLKLYPEAALRKGGDIAWAIRKNSPQLKAELDAFLAKYPDGSSARNQLFQRYLKGTKFVKNSMSAEERAKFDHMVELFKTYSDKYDMDFLLMAAQGYQESQLNQQAKSPVGAVGVMQLMPATGKELKVGDISQLEPNIHAGVKYMRFMIDQYYANEPMDKLNKGLFAFASYNAGPGRIRALRKEAAKRGLDPNKWFDNVEIVASEKIGRETVTYVANIYKYYVAYTLVTENAAAREKAREKVKDSP